MKKKQNNLMNKIIDFIKYHNGFVIGLILVFVFTGAIFASEDIHNAIIGEETITQTGIDNTVILAADLENFDLAMTINGVFEDEINYYVSYSFKTLGVLDNIWQEISRTAQMTISKAAIAGQDLGIYLTEELSEVVNHELTYLKQVQVTEKEKGQTQVVQTRDYTGLVGMVLDIKDKILPGYEPVIKPVKPEPVESFDLTDQFDDWLEPTCDTDHLDLCNTQELCEGVGLFWYNDVCNLEAEAEPEDFPVTTGEDEEIPSAEVEENPEPDV